jgi:hypothetical protein
MNTEVEVNVKIRVSEESPPAEPPRTAIAALLERIAAHPCVLFIVREILRSH